jgi:DNA mismatch endonuclease (patch repair protein)
MVDKFSKKTRSSIMSRIRGKNTGIECALQRGLNKEGLKHKSHYQVGPGTTSIDIAFTSKKIAVFVDGCFWHGCPKHYKIPKKKFWINKIERNKLRDRKIRARLKRNDWVILRFWEHELRKNPDKCIAKVKRLYEYLS